MVDYTRVLRACTVNVVGVGTGTAMIDPGDRVECLNAGVGGVVMVVVVVVIARAAYSHTGVMQAQCTTLTAVAGTQ